MVAACVMAVSLVLFGQVPAVAAPPKHDFDANTLASYVSQRFSSAVPPTVIKAVLAREGFSKRDLDLITAQGPSPRPLFNATASYVSDPAVMFAQQISRDTLRCPSSDPSCEVDTQTEPQMASNPANGANMVGVFQQGRYPDGGSVDPGFATSFDGGKTWPYKGSAPKLTVAVGGRFARGSDAVVGFDRKHNSVLFNTLDVSVQGCADFCDSAVAVNISNNAGRSFGSPVIAHEDASDPKGSSFVFNDKNWIATDNNPASPHYGRTYASWDQVRCQDPSCTTIDQPVVLTYSDNGGKSWSPMIQATNDQPAQLHGETGSQPVIEPNGDVVITYADVAAGAFTFEGTYKAIRSTDGGKTWSAPQMIDGADPASEELNGLRAPNLPSAATDAKGKIYFAFQDQRFGPGRNDILLTSSPDEGKTWASSANATPSESSLDHFTPAIAATPSGVALTYRTHAPSNVSSDPTVHAMSRTLNGSAQTTSGPFELSSPSDASVAAFTTLDGQTLRFFGDYAGIAPSSVGSNPIWDQSQNFAGQQQNPTNTHQRTFSAQVK